MAASRGLLYGDITAKIIGAFYEVHKELNGIGYPELVYKNAMLIALRDKGLHCEVEVPMKVMFRGKRVGFYRADLIVEKLVIVEIKTGSKIHEIHRQQTYKYLKTSKLKVGLIMNFGLTAEFERCYLDVLPT